MKTTDNAVPKALREVWMWKEAVFRDVGKKTFAEKRAYFAEGVKEAARILKGKVRKNPDGSYSIV